MGRKWNVTVDGEAYDIEYINNKKIFVNGSELRLRDYQTNMTMTTTEHEIPLGNKKACLIVRSFNDAQLMIDGMDCASGKAFEPARAPKWAGIFMLLHCVNIVNGLSGCATAILGIGLTGMISSHTRLGASQKVVLNLVVLLLAYGIGVINFLTAF